MRDTFTDVEDLGLDARNKVFLVLCRLQEIIAIRDLDYST
jgi:hypothetical protein